MRIGRLEALRNLGLSLRPAFRTCCAPMGFECFKQPWSEPVAVSAHCKGALIGIIQQFM